ncbi:hypothetical protein C8R47DRAFT_1195989 [Mycena vitilis]|nr:hypothetical protein C8R47DRAFT_1195989 [Mycena vitilis]
MATPSSPADVLQVEVTLFNTFSFLGVFSLLLVIGTAYFSSTVHRSGLWFRHMIAWIIYSVSYLLLLGRQVGPTPPFGLCLVQAALIHAAPTLPTLSALCFVIDLYIGLSAAVHRKRKIRPALAKFLLVFPQLVFTAVILEVLLFIQDAGVVARNPNHLYCHITTPTPSVISAGIVIGTGVIIFPLEIWIGIVLCRNWVAFRNSPEMGIDPQVSLTMFIRVGLFTVISMTGVGLSSFTLVSPSSNPYWSLVLPTVPIIASITFGSQEDIMKALVFWRESGPAPAPTSATSGSTSDLPKSFDNVLV